MNKRFAIPRAAYFLILYALMLAACMGRVYRIESHSMQPSLYEGDYIRVNQVELAELQRGDLVMYASPQNEEELHIKRLIGFPGESIEIKDGVLYLNGTILVEEYPVLPIQSTSQLGLLVLGADEYFILGDNRPQSSDSRFHGPIPARLIKGKATVR